MPTMDKILLKIIFIDPATLSEARNFISGCDHCAWTSEMTFRQLLDALTGSDPATTEYVIRVAATCPSCDCEITEDSFIIAT
jgi:hypothetical protein